MSNEPATRPNTVLIVCASVLVAVTILCVTLIAVAVEDGARSTTLIGLVAAPLTTGLGVLVVLGKVQNVERQVSEVKDHTYDLTNGLLDAKVRAAIGDILAPHLLDDDAREQLEADRAVRDSRNRNRQEKPRGA